MSKKTVAKYQRLNRPNISRQRRSRHRGKRSWGKIILVLALVLLVGLSYGGWRIYSVYTSPVGRHTETQYLFVTKSTTLSELRESIQVKLYPNHPNWLDYLIDRADLGKHLRPGRYAITPQMTASDLVDALISGPQAPVKIPLRGNIRTEADLIQELDKYLMADSLEIAQALGDSTLLASTGLTREQIRGLFLVGDYEILWDITPTELMQTFVHHHADYWTSERKALAGQLGLSPAEVTALSTIVDAESAKRDEHSRIAGLYINRLRRQMPLQSDPTVIYAIGDWNIRRVLATHLQVASAYNTYQHAGLPPGPIRLPHPTTIDSVLRAEDHTYIYMCARETFDGYHNFASDYGTHLRNARLYQRALTARQKNQAEATASTSSAK